MVETISARCIGTVEQFVGVSAFMCPGPRAVGRTTVACQMRGCRHDASDRGCCGRTCVIEIPEEQKVLRLSSRILSVLFHADSIRHSAFPGDRAVAFQGRAHRHIRQPAAGSCVAHDVGPFADRGKKQPVRTRETVAGAVGDHRLDLPDTAVADACPGTCFHGFRQNRS